MELRHLRYYITVAEELHFARAAKRLHIEQSPLSRAIKDLEDDLGTRLFDRSTRNSRLTRAGSIFVGEARHILAAVEQARASVTAAAQGYHGSLRIAVADALSGQRMTKLFARWREVEPAIELRVSEMSVAQLINALQKDEIDAGFTLFHGEGEDEYIVEPIWHDKVITVMKATHPLASHKRVRLVEVLQYPLIMYHPELCQGGFQYVRTMLRNVNLQPRIAENIYSLGAMLTLVGAGFGIGFALESQVPQFRRSDVVVRQLDIKLTHVTTYLMRVEAPFFPPLGRFIDRAKAIGQEHS